MSELSGKPFSWLDMYGGQDPDLPTPAEAQAAREYFKAFQDAMNIKYPNTGKVIIMGTGGDMDKGDLQDIFYNPDNYKIKDDE
jgi:hypothetical protein